MKLDKSDWRNYEQGIQKEWILTNGIGGFSSSTVIGANARRYHGLLFASFNPPVQRKLLLSKIDESIFIDGTPYNIYSFSTCDYKMTGYNHLQEFKLDPLPEYKFIVENVIVEKKICMVYGKNAVNIVYKIKNTEHLTKIRLSILVNYRDFHSNSKADNMFFDIDGKSKSMIVSHKDSKHSMKILIDDGQIINQYNTWFKSMYYDLEAERGLDAYEDHFIPGYIEVSVNPWEEKEFTVYAEAGLSDDIRSQDLICPNGKEIIKDEIKRMKAVEDRLEINDGFAKVLARAADTFIVRRESTDAKTIIAGYPWFSDWGRDAMIGFTGLTLVTKRYQNAKQILFTYSKYIKDGLIPNMFPDEGTEPLYNSVDAALWFFEAVNNYIKYTNDLEFVKMNLFDNMILMIENFKKGTVFNIFMDTDGLISAGDENSQITWMDAKVEDWVVTPRHGKAVEINALWYNALKVMEKLGKLFELENKEYGDISKKVKKTFIEKFWNNELKCLYDVIGENFIDSRIRPNQIIAISLTYPIIKGEKAKYVVEKVWNDLYTPLGLKSLADYEPGYSGTYTGGQYSRDGAYHQGTVWVWPLGHFITAFLRVYKGRKKFAKDMIEPFKNHINNACIGSISEIFEGNEPHKPKGCFAQAWSVAEVLRVYVENELYK